MKNHKGAVAALLTLGLVVIGALITIRTSLFVSKQKTNMALNSRASFITCSTKIDCHSINSSFPAGTKFLYKVNSQDRYMKTNCSGEIFEGPGSYCKPTTVAPTTPPTGGGGTTTCPYTYDGAGDANETCRPNSYTRSNCPTGKFRCNSAVTPTQPPSGGAGGTTNTDGSLIGSIGGCCFGYKKNTAAHTCADGQIYVRQYASADYMQNIADKPCTTEAYNSAYNADWFDCSDIPNYSGGTFGGDGCYPPDGYSSVVPTDIPVNYPIGVTPPFGCTVVPSTGCGIYRGSNSTRQTIDGYDWCCPDTHFVTPVPRISGASPGAGTPAAGGSGTATPKPGQPSVTPISRPTPTAVPGQCTPATCPAPNQSIPYYYKVSGFQTNYYADKDACDKGNNLNSYSDLINNYCNDTSRNMTANFKLNINSSKITDARSNSQYLVRIIGDSGTHLAEKNIGGGSNSITVAFSSKNYLNYTGQFCYETNEQEVIIGCRYPCIPPYKQHCINQTLPYSSDNILNFMISN